MLIAEIECCNVTNDAIITDAVADRDIAYNKQALREESVKTAFVRRQNSVAFSSCSQLEIRMILSIVLASDASDVVSFL